MSDRNPDGTFKKGHSASGAGRPKGVRQKAIEACEKYGVDPLYYFAEVLADKASSKKDRIACAKELADRMYGKPQQSIEVDNKTIEISIRKPDKEN